MARFICRMFQGDEECSFETIIPIEHPDGPDGFQLQLFELAAAHMMLRKVERATTPPREWEHDEFIFMGREWSTAELINPDGSWNTGNFEFMTMDEWFSQEGCYPEKGKE